MKRDMISATVPFLRVSGDVSLGQNASLVFFSIDGRGHGANAAVSSGACLAVLLG